ncbi:hypothetical protein GCM10025876_03700 [Demequina litorisediminis]|uniref:Uncharacterized protein n=1 Tax=Demequina litorisediminis TaxID=1849022 RepID=A0ABQ6I8Y4_9MICO|nr:hypothetical protein GCM10025876_03700 [Demequina litorisediminis]
MSGEQPSALPRLAPHLRHLERVREARAYEVTAAEPENLRLGAEPAQRARVEDARTVPLEGGALGGLGGLGDPPLNIGIGVPGRDCVHAPNLVKPAPMP